VASIRKAASYHQVRNWLFGISFFWGGPCH